MGAQHLETTLLFELAAGRGEPEARRHAGECARCRAALDLAGLLLDLGRAARAVRGPGLDARKRAEARILERRPAPEPAGRRLPLLAVLFDSWALPAPAVRAAGAASERLLRLGGGEVLLDLHVRKGARGLDLLGAFEPGCRVREVSAEAGGRTVKAAVDREGEFALRGLPGGRVRLLLDGRVAAEVDL